MPNVTRTTDIWRPAVKDYEQLVVAVFADVLGEDEADLTPDMPFAHLGGSSLDASLVCARLAARLGRDVPVSGMAHRQTAAALATWLYELDREERSTRSDPVRVGAVAEPPTRPGQVLALAPEPCAFLMAQLTDPADRSAYCLMLWTVEGQWDQGAFDAALADVHGRHEALNSVYRLDEEAVAVPGRAPAPRTVAVGDWPSADAAQAAVRAELETALDLERGPVWRVAVAGWPGGGRVLGLVVHHIAFDGWSEAVLADHLSHAYRRRLEGRAPDEHALPGLAEQWSARRRRAERAIGQGQLDRRAEALAGMPDLPWSPTAPPQARPRPVRQQHHLSADDMAAVDRLASAYGVTRFAVLLAVYGAALAQATGLPEFGVGVPVAGRSDPLTRDSVGCFVGTVCVRLRAQPVDGMLRPQAALAAAEAAAAAFAAQDVPLADLVRVVNPDRRPGRSPLFQNIFALQDTSAPLLRIPGAKIRHLRQPYPDLPVELLTEVRPDDEQGGASLVTSHRPGSVPEDVPTALARTFLRIVGSLHAADLPPVQEPVCSPN